jgi:hypothetical protein
MSLAPFTSHPKLRKSNSVPQWTHVAGLRSLCIIGGFFLRAILEPSACALY